MNKRLKNLLKIAISAGLIIFLLTRIDIKALLAELAAANGGWVLVTFLLFAFSIILRAVRWKVLLDALAIRAPLSLLSRWYFIGAFFNTLLPTGFGGDVIRMMYLAQYSKQAPSAVGTVILDRFLGILVLLGLGVLAIPFSRAEISIWVNLFILAVFAAAAGGFWLLRQERLIRWFQQRVLALFPAGIRARIQKLDWLKPLYVALQGYDRKTLAKALLASLIFNLVWVLVNITAGLALGVNASLVDYLVFVPLVSLALLLPSVGGIGVRELSYVGLFTQIGVASETAFAMSIIIYAVTVATGLIGGVMLLIQNVTNGQQSTAKRY
jgi:uncharacterized protein (TIRG00374 family)